MKAELEMSCASFGTHVSAKDFLVNPPTPLPLFLLIFSRWSWVRSWAAAWGGKSARQKHSLWRCMKPNWQPSQVMPCSQHSSLLIYSEPTSLHVIMLLVDANLLLGESLYTLAAGNDFSSAKELKAEMKAVYQERDRLEALSKRLHSLSLGSSKELALMKEQRQQLREELGQKEARHGESPRPPWDGLKTTANLPPQHTLEICTQMCTLQGIYCYVPGNKMMVTRQPPELT